MVIMSENTKYFRPKRGLHTLAEIKNSSLVLVSYFFIEEPVNITVDMLTGIGLKFSLKLFKEHIL